MDNKMAEQIWRDVDGIERRIACNEIAPAAAFTLMKQLISQALSAPRVPDGWKLVPNKLTQEMIDAGAKHCFNKDSHDEDEKYRAVGEAICVWSEMLAASPEPVTQTIERDSGTLTVDETGAVSKIEPKRYEDTQASRGIPAENIMHDLDAALSRIMTGDDENGDVTFIRSAFKAWSESAANERDLRAEVEALKAVNAKSIAAMVEAKSLAASVSRARSRQCEFDGEVFYMQTDEWCRWATDEVLPLITSAIDAARLREGGSNE